MPKSKWSLWGHICGHKTCMFTAKIQLGHTCILAWPWFAFKWGGSALSRPVTWTKFFSFKWQAAIWAKSPSKIIGILINEKTKKTVLLRRKNDTRHNYEKIAKGSFGTDYWVQKASFNAKKWFLGVFYGVTKDHFFFYKYCYQRS